MILTFSLQRREYQHGCHFLKATTSVVKCHAQETYPSFFQSPIMLWYKILPFFVCVRVCITKEETKPL